MSTTCKYSVVGIDQSLTGTGLALLSKDGTHSTTRLKPKVFGVERLLYIETAVDRWLSAGADLAVMEGYAFGARDGRIFGLGECGGIIKRAVHLKGIRLISVAPGTLKKYISGHGDAKKNLMLLAAYKKFGVEFETDDECDAYCLARLGMEYLDAEAGTITSAFAPTYKAVAKYNARLQGEEIDE